MTCSGFFGLITVWVFFFAAGYVMPTPRLPNRVLHRGSLAVLTSNKNLLISRRRWAGLELSLGAESKDKP